jgi:ABC-type Fe3+ transport system substrate-binding protein
MRKTTFLVRWWAKALRLQTPKHRKPAEKFVDFLVSEQGQGFFEKHNYRTTPPQ